MYRVLDSGDVLKLPRRQPHTPFQMTVTKFYKEKGVGDMVQGKVLEGKLSPGSAVAFVGSYKPQPDAGKLFHAELHYNQVENLLPGDILQVKIGGFNQDNLPMVGDIMVSTGGALKEATSFEAGIAVASPGMEFQVGSTVVAFAGARFSPCKITALQWKGGPDTGGKKCQTQPL